MLGEVAIRAAGTRERIAPFLVVALAFTRQKSDAVADLDQTRDILRAFNIACEPIEVVSSSSQHSRVSFRPVPISPARPRCLLCRHPGSN